MINANNLVTIIIRIATIIIALAILILLFLRPHPDHPTPLRSTTRLPRWPA